MHDWSGQMAIKVAGQYMVFDLYAHTHQAISVYPYHSPLKLVPLESPTLNDLPIPISRPPLNQRFNNPLPLIGKAYDRLLRRSPDRFSQVIYNAPALMAPQERVLLYSLVFAVDPERCLEIGTNRGGSAAIIVAALDDLGGDGLLVCVDPERLFSEELWADIQHRAVFVQGASPLALAGIDRLAGGPFDVVNIDGLHDYDHTLADARGVLPYLADEAYILFHDAYYYEVEQAVDQFLRENNGILTDSGVLSHSPNPEEATPERVWGGIRVLRFRKSQAPS